MTQTVSILPRLENVRRMSTGWQSTAADLAGTANTQVSSLCTDIKDLATSTERNMFCLKHAII